jgi:threonine dehydratase
MRVALEEIQAARDRISGAAVRTPLVRLDADGPGEIWLKLENLQPIRSFKIRGAVNAVRAADADEVGRGLVTASAGNMAQGVAWVARELGVPATIVVPEHAPEAKTSAIERLGGTVSRVPYADWWHALETSRAPGVHGLFVHPFTDERVMAGNGTIALEILEDLPEPDAVLVPYGGGGLVSGIASALRWLRPETRVYTVEPATGAALHAALAAGAPTQIAYQPSFVDGAGSPTVLPQMLERVRALVDGALTVSADQAAAAVRLLAQRASVVAEGAGALAPAAALADASRPARVVCVVSGGNIDPSKLGSILAGQTP